jgi:18S rRNA (guanine1575-N7)-methyltransferase
MKNGFTGGLIVDYPNSKKAKKYFLFLMAGYSEEIVNDAKEAIYVPKALGEGDNSEDEEDKQISVFKDQKKSTKFNRRTQFTRKGVNHTQWVKNKKERQRRQGRDVRPDSKYTARKRKDHF